MKTRSSPMRYFRLYIMFTMFISFYGPAVYVGYDRLSVLVFMTVFLVLISIGFMVGLSIKTGPPTRAADSQVAIEGKRAGGHAFVFRLLKASIVIVFLLTAAEFIQLMVTNRELFSLSRIGANYLEAKFALSSGDSYSAFHILRFLSGFPRLVATVLGMYEYSSLSTRYRCLLVSFLVLDVLVYSIAYGIQKGLGDIVIYLIIAMYVKMLDSPARKKRKAMIKILSVLAVFICFVAMMQFQRSSEIGMDAANIQARSDGSYYYDLDNWIFRVFGQRFGFGLVTFLTGYLSAGYYGLSLCLKLPFVWTYGFGSAYPMSVFVNRFLGLPFFYSDTYLNRMEIATGHPGLMLWNTVFPWLASDLTFVGALLLFVPVGVLYAISWKETVLYKNPVSFLMFAMLTLGLVFVPANNQLFNSVDGYIATVMVVVFWLLNHRRCNHLQST